MHQTIPMIIKCSKCKSENIVNPYNEEDVEFRCLDCGHEKKPVTYIGNGPPMSWGKDNTECVIKV